MSEYQRPPDHERRMAAACAWAQWHLGSRSYAGRIIEAYEYPDETLAELRTEQLGPEDRK